MRKILKLMLLLVCVINLTYAHKEWVHRVLSKAGYNYLKLNVGEIWPLRDHIGFSANGYGNDDEPWESGLISIAVWREDRDDPIWGHGGITDGVTPSVTHFWDADNGDNAQTLIPGYGEYENAYQKAKIYLFGGHRIFFKKTSYANEIGQVILGRYYSYNSLAEFFTTGKCYYEGYIDVAGYSHLISPTLTYMDLNTAQKYAYQLLGRVAHLLQDMSVPAHVHNDIHPCDIGDPDSFEQYMGGSPLDILNCNYQPEDFPTKIIMEVLFLMV